MSSRSRDRGREYSNYRSDDYRSDYRSDHRSDYRGGDSRSERDADVESRRDYETSSSRRLSVRDRDREQSYRRDQDYRDGDSYRGESIHRDRDREYNMRSADTRSDNDLDQRSATSSVSRYERRGWLPPGRNENTEVTRGESVRTGYSERRDSGGGHARSELERLSRNIQDTKGLLGDLLSLNHDEGDNTRVYLSKKSEEWKPSQRRDDQSSRKQLSVLNNMRLALDKLEMCYSREFEPGSLVSVGDFEDVGMTQLLTEESERANRLATMARENLPSEELSIVVDNLRATVISMNDNSTTTDLRFGDVRNGPEGEIDRLSVITKYLVTNISPFINRGSASPSALLEAENARLREDLKRLESQKENYSNKLLLEEQDDNEKMSELIHGKNQTISEQSAKITELENQLSDYHNNENKLIDRNETDQDHLEELLDEMTELRERNKQLHSEIKDLTMANDGLETSKPSVRMDNKIVQTDYTDNENDTERVQELMNTIIQREDEVNELLKQNDEKQRQVEELENVLMQDGEGRDMALSERLEELQRVLDDREIELQDAYEELASKEDINELRQINEELHERIRQLEDNTDSGHLVADLSSLITTLQQKETEGTHKVEELQERIDLQHQNYLMQQELQKRSHEEALSKLKKEANGKQTRTPAKRRKKRLQEISDTKKYPFLGLELGALRSELGGHGGLRIVEVRGPSLAAGLQQGDLIIEVEGTEITSQESLKAVLQQHPPDQAVYMKLIRDETLYEVEVEPAESDIMPGNGAKYTAKVYVKSKVPSYLVASKSPPPASVRGRSPPPTVNQYSTTPRFSASELREQANEIFRKHELIGTAPAPPAHVTGLLKQKSSR